jgi:hypothetical protein
MYASKIVLFFSLFPQCFPDWLHQSTGVRMDVPPRAPYNQQINHLGVIAECRSAFNLHPNCQQSALPRGPLFRVLCSRFLV